MKENKEKTIKLIETIKASYLSAYKEAMYNEDPSSALMFKMAMEVCDEILEKL